MILDDLAKKAIESSKKNNLVLEEFFLDDTFTFSIVTNGSISQIGVTLTPKGEGIIQNLKYKSIEEILNDKSFDVSSRAIKLATINAIGQFELRDETLDLKPNLRVALFETIIANSNKEDKIVFIGNLKPVVMKLREQRDDVTVFCRAMSIPENQVYNDIFEYEAVENADVVIITGAALIGSTIDALLKFTNKAKTVILAGFSAGINPQWLDNHKVTHVASTYLKDYTKKDILNSSLESIFDNNCYVAKIR